MNEQILAQESEWFVLGFPGSGLMTLGSGSSYCGIFPTASHMVHCFPVQWLSPHTSLSDCSQTWVCLKNKMSCVSLASVKNLDSEIKRYLYGIWHIEVKQVQVDSRAQMLLALHVQANIKSAYRPVLVLILPWSPSKQVLSPISYGFPPSHPEYWTLLSFQRVKRERPAKAGMKGSASEDHGTQISFVTLSWLLNILTSQ